jgi:hypothetical protein
MDPRLWMAQVYRNIKGEALKAFEAEINNCQGPDDAIAICQKYLATA